MGLAPHPAPYTLHPTPYTLLPTPSTFHPPPHRLQPTPHTLHHTPYTLHPTPYTLHSTPDTPHSTPYTLHPTTHALHLTPSTRNPKYGWVTRWGTPKLWGTPMFGNVTALEGLHVRGKHRDRSMQHTCSRHAAGEDPHAWPHAWCMYAACFFFFFINLQPLKK